MPATFVYFLAAALLAEVIGTIAGFGATTILLPIAAFLFPLPIAIAYSALFHSLGTMWRTVFFARKIDWKIALTFGIAALVFSYLGGRLLAVIETDIISKALGGTLIAYSLYSLVKHRLYLPKSWMFLVSGGVITGFLAGLVGTAGAIRGAFLTAWKLPKKVYLGTGAVMGLGADVFRLIAYHQDNLLPYDWQLYAAFLAVAFVGTLLGFKLVENATSKLFARVVLVALVLAGVRFLLL